MQGPLANIILQKHPAHHHKKHFLILTIKISMHVEINLGGRIQRPALVILLQIE